MKDFIDEIRSICSKENGINGLESKKKPGNPLAKYSAKKELTEKEKLEYEIMKLKIENERLKKGYLVKGSGSRKEFVTGSGRSFRSSKI